MGNKVLVTATTFPRYKDDTEPSFVFELCKQMKKDYEQIALVPSSPVSEDEEEIEGIKIRRFRYFLKKYQKLCYEGGILPNMKKSFLARIQAPFLVIAEFFAVRKAVKNDKIKLIHAHWILPQGFIAYLIKKLYKVPYIATAHAGDVFPLKKGVFRKIAQLTIKNADFVTANSTYTKNVLLDIYPELNPKKTAIIPMGVDFSTFNKSKKSISLRYKYKINGELLLTVGRLAEKKGIKYLIEAMPLVLREYPEAKLIIIGDGPEKQSLLRLSGMLNLNENIIFLDKMPSKELPRYYASADIFIGPSIITESGDTEGLGVVFLEAIASGTPAIGSNVGGIPDIIKDNETGLLVEQKNPEELSKKINYLLRHKQIRETLAKEGRLFIEKNYSWQNIGKRFKAVYTKTLQNTKVSQNEV